MTSKQFHCLCSLLTYKCAWCQFVIVAHRARETVGEEPMPHPRGAETSSKGQDPSVPDDAGNNSSDKPSNHNHQQQHPKKKARYKNLNEISGAGEKSQRTLDGKKWTVGGPSRLHHNAEDFIDRSGQNRDYFTLVV